MKRVRVLLVHVVLSSIAVISACDLLGSPDRSDDDPHDGEVTSRMLTVQVDQCPGALYDVRVTVTSGGTGATLLDQAWTDRVGAFTLTREFTAESVHLDVLVDNLRWLPEEAFLTGTNSGTGDTQLVDAAAPFGALYNATGEFFVVDTTAPGSAVSYVPPIVGWDEITLAAPFPAGHDYAMYAAADIMLRVEWTNVGTMKLNARAPNEAGSLSFQTDL